MRSRYLAKFIIFVVIVVTALMVIRQPGLSAESAQGIGSWFTEAADGIGAFIDNLFN